MGNPNNGNSSSNGEKKSDRGSWPLSDNGQRPVSSRPLTPAVNPVYINLGDFDYAA